MKAGVQTAHVALSDAEDAWNRRENLEKRKVMSVDETRRAEFAVQSARARVAEAEANLAAAEADVHTVEVELERSRVVAPIDGTILRVDIRAGEYASAGGGGGNSLIVIGNVAPLHARVDVDESETWRFAPDAAATASVRGNARQRSRLRYVRTEPLVRPKQMLTGSASERVDTRVLQVIYEILEPTGFYVGQQLDVFIDEQHLAAAGTER
jgi:multidrug efflux pump subunit AcrA (membrane-fusion protein)